MSLERLSIDIGGKRRTYLLSAPAVPPSAVMFCLHGSRSDAVSQARYSRMEKLTERGAAVVFPQAIRPAGSGFEWDDAQDMAYLRQLTAEMIDRYQPVSGRVAMTGMSGGARMSCRFAWEHAELVQMVGAVAGLRALSGAPTRPVPILAFHGTADRINPYRGSATARWGESVEDSALGWAMVNGAGATPVRTEQSATLVRTTYGADGSPGEVTLWTCLGAGHTWPGSPPRFGFRLLLGKTSTEVDATELIWTFAKRHMPDK